MGTGAVPGAFEFPWYVEIGQGRQTIGELRVTMIIGGGFVLGGLANESTLCMSMCDGAGVAVVDVNYRHCPGS